MRLLALPLLVFVPSLGLATNAMANGRYPEAGQVILSASDERILIRATFGFVLSKDGGASWRWICEQSIGFYGVEDPSVGFTEGDAIIAGLSVGLARSTDLGCTFSSSPPLAGEYLIDLTVRQSTPSEALAVTTTPSMSGLRTSVYRTMDGGASWQATGPELGADFRAVTLEMATSDPSRIYVSGLLEQIPYVPVVAVSDDGGQTFTRIEDFGSDNPVFISAVDPADPDRLFARARVSDTTDGLYLSEDGGQSFSLVVERPGQMLGFAMSPDGSRIAIGGPGFGIETADAAQLTFTSRSAVGARCLTWSPEALYVCADEATDGFTLGRSPDEGVTISPIFNIPTLLPLECPAETTTGSICPEFWPGVASLLGIDAGTPSAASTGSGSDGPTDSDDGCDCSLEQNGEAAADWSATAFVTASILAAINRRRRRRRPIRR
jgi:photosystem II stability/assembly factor-like uncharacterized protein